MRILNFESFVNESTIVDMPAPAPAKPGTSPSPATKPGTSPSTNPGRPSPIRRDRPSVDPAPKALLDKKKKITEDEIAKMYLKMNTGRLRR